MNTNKYYEFDFVMVDKIHENLIFSNIKNNLESLICCKKHPTTMMNDCVYVKSRPAIIVAKISNNHFLVAPLTTQTSQSPYRTFLNKTNSNIMWDSLMRVSKDQIISKYRLKGRLFAPNESFKKILAEEKNLMFVNMFKIKSTK
ncbi:type II toxin-antitoxin system PemK/MazF family toxin [[Acholeplasma] multilocale]|uniref:type II toxin-antitoxin system PemK/MazF family toxin n=1 Tax=[Acholeplasma] multilocale TaxID=264638 RepID=UPI00047E5DD8|nr:type II toxin-antitoxin system PemK/MazF family toxin [[Acholeplasma] multilocale]